MPAPLSLPLIDISPFLTAASEADRAATAQALHEACRTKGFFYLKGHGISKPEMDEVLKVARGFFERPASEKEQIGIAHEDMARGYQRTGENVTLSKPDWHEGIDFYAPSPFPPQQPGASRPLPPLSGSNQWPSHPEDFKRVVKEWVEKMKVVGEAVMRATAMGLGMNKAETEQLLGLIKDSFWVLRCIGYPQLPSTHDGVSCGAHKDYGCYTLLHSDSTRGALQVFLRERDPETGKAVGQGQWLNADPVEGAFVVNIGEMWQIWTNGLYQATLHRVVHKGQEYRVSVPFFYEPNFDALIEPLPAALRLQSATSRAYAENMPEEHNKPKSHPVVYGDFLLKKVGGNFEIKDGKAVKGRY